MLSDFDIRPMVGKLSAIPIDRLRIVRTWDELRFSDIRRGIIFIFAAWSGPAVQAFGRFTRTMNSMGTRSLDLVVLDTDCLTQDSATTLFGTEHFTTGGWGETIWIRDGAVIAREILRDGSEALLERHTKELLDENVA